MKSAFRVAGLATLTFAVMVVVSLAMQPAIAAEPAKDGFQEIFDGKTLTGWHKNPKPIGHGDGGHWVVEDGAITGEQDPPGSGNGGILLTDRKYGDFELLIDMKPDWGVCSGLFVRSNDEGQCFQMMVDYHEAGNVGHIYGEGSGGFNNRPFEIFGKYENETLTSIFTKPSASKVPPAYSIEGAEWVKAWKVGDWNTAKVRVVGNPAHITTWINDVKVSEFDGDKFNGDNYCGPKVKKLLGPQGSVAVQVHGGKSWPEGAKCRWKNIKIKSL